MRCRWLPSLCLVLGASLPSASAEKHLVDFDSEILPILAKAGCNSAACSRRRDGPRRFSIVALRQRP